MSKFDLPDTRRRDGGRGGNDFSRERVAPPLPYTIVGVLFSLS
jgi:hypothetical protein